MDETSEQTDACQEKGKRQELRKNRSEIMKQIRKRIRILENEKINKQLAEIEGKKDDSNKCYQAIRTLNNRKPKKPLIVQGEDGSIAGSEKRTDNFNNETFPKNVHDGNERITPNDTTV